MVLRLPDFYGPGVERSFLHGVFEGAARGERAQMIGPIDTPHEFMFMPDLGPVVGYVVTSEWTSMDPESPDLNFLDYYEWITHQPKPAFVVSKAAS